MENIPFITTVQASLYPLFILHDLLHSLLEDRVPPGLADNQVSPLHNHNAGEEGSVAGELHNLSLFICLKLSSKEDVRTTH